MNKLVFVILSTIFLYGESGENIFKSKCMDCHGDKAQIYALGYSDIISGWPVRKLAYIIRGYRDGSYGGGMSEVMQEQVQDLSDKEIYQLANYIHNLY
jgi:cytochrome c553